MFSDSQTVNSVAMPRTGMSLDAGVFTSADTSQVLAVRQQSGKRYRRTVRLDHRKVVPDTLVPDVNRSVSLSCYLVVDTPREGYTVAEQKALVDAVLAWLSASTGANVTKLLGGEV